MGRVFAVSDLHGRYDLFTQIKEFLEPDDIVYVLGDCGDRGPKGWKIITEVYENPQFIYLKGNHEDMLVKAMQSFRTYDKTETEFFFDYDHDYRLCRGNGGEKTFKQWIRDTRGDYSWVKKLENLSYYCEYTNKNGEKIILCHAGFTWPEDGIMPNNSDLLWDREHFNDITYNTDPIIVHGHTPIPYLSDYLKGAPRENKVEPGAFWYANGRKVDIDTGAFFTGCAVLLNLDSWDEEIFLALDCVYEV